MVINKRFTIASFHNKINKRMSEFICIQSHYAKRNVYIHISIVYAHKDYKDHNCSYFIKS